LKAVLPLSNLPGGKAPSATVTEFTHLGRRALRDLRRAT
jgi:hypothetical protein